MLPDHTGAKLVAAAMTGGKGDLRGVGQDTRGV